MSVVDEFRKMSFFDVFLALAAFMVTIAPGFLIFFVFFTDFPKGLDTFELVILSAAVTLPAAAVYFSDLYT